MILISFPGQFVNPSCYDFVVVYSTGWGENPVLSREGEGERERERGSRIPTSLSLWVEDSQASLFHHHHQEAGFKSFFPRLPRYLRTAFTPRTYGTLQRTLGELLSEHLQPALFRAWKGCMDCSPGDEGSMYNRAS